MSDDLNDLVKEAMGQLEGLGLSEGTLRMYDTRAFRPALRICSAKGIAGFQETTEIELQLFYRKQCGDGEISKQTLNWRLRGLGILSEVHDTGLFEWKVFNRRESIFLSDFFEDTLSAFTASLTCCEKRKQNYSSIIRRFIAHMDSKDMHDFSKVDPIMLRDFILQISADRPKSMDDVIVALRKFFEYLHNHGLVDTMFWTLLAAPRSRDHKVRPCMQQDEVATLLRQIDRGSQIGKRDFAIILLAATTGLRAGDMASLKMADVSWEHDELHLVQGKTREALLLPLQKPAKTAIANYILHGRPESQSEYLFLRHCAPHDRFRDGVSVACIFRKYLAMAGIPHSIDDGKTLHGIRRMLGTKMATGGIPVTTIAQVLGQKGNKATKRYIPLDVDGLRRCALGMESIRGECR